MRTTDVRTLSAAPQEALRRSTMKAVLDGMTHAEAARVFEVADTGVTRWVAEYLHSGARAVKAKRRGRPPGTQVAPRRAILTVRLIADRWPDQLRLPFALWTREAVHQLLAERLGLPVSV